jgi:hypothetical protein
MIHTIEKLIIVINDYEIKIRQYEINLACFHQNYDERERLEQRKKVLKKQIEYHIQQFKEKTKNNHLETRLYANRLAVLEKKFQIQPRIMSSNLFCLNVLKEKHAIIEKDKFFFSKINQNQEAKICEDELQMIEIQSQNLLKEFFESMNTFPESIDKEMKLQFSTLLCYYGWGFAEKKITLDKRQIELENRLKLLEKKSNRIWTLFNYKLAKNSKTEIKKIKEELLEIKLENSKNIDYYLVKI